LRQQGTVTGVDDRAPAVPSLQLRQAVSNPSSATTRLEVLLDEDDGATLEIFDVAGRGC